jgi:hypothetical protein
MWIVLRVDDVQTLVGGTRLVPDSWILEVSTHSEMQLGESRYHAGSGAVKPASPAGVTG